MDKKLMGKFLLIECYSKLANHFLKFCTLGGIICISVYCVKIGYFPQELSLGDSVILVVICFFFGAIYALCLSGLWFSGFLIAFLLNPFIKLYGVMRKRKVKYLPNQFMNYPLWFRVLLSLWGLSFLINIVYLDTGTFGSSISILIMCIAAEYTLYIVYLDVKTQALIDENFKIGKWICIIVLCVFPLLVLPIVGSLLESSMRLGTIRSENNITHIKKGIYSSSIIESGGERMPSVNSDYVTFSNLRVLFSGIGKNVIVDIIDDEKVNSTKFVIPNEYIFFQRIKKQ